MPDQKKEERKQLKLKMDEIGSTEVNYFTIGNREFGVEQEPGDADKKVKLKAMEKGVKAVLDLGFVLPDRLKLITSNTAGIPCVAYMGTKDDEDYVLFLGPKATEQNPASKSVVAVRGGLGTKGERGIANVAFDANKKAQDQVTAIVVHEIGHILHCSMSGTKFWAQKDNPADVEAATLATKISHYATKNSLEYVAEFFVATVLGFTDGFDDDALVKKYAKLGGPSSSKFTKKIPTG